MPDRSAYADLTELKGAGWLNITGTTFDTQLLALCEMASRYIDRHTNRYYYAKTETKYFDGDDGSRELWLPDLLSVTTLKTDEQADAVYERTWAATDYILWPSSGLPKLRLEADKRSTSNKYTFPRGQRSIELAGLWGYGDGQDRATPYDAGTLLDTTVTSIQTSWTVSAPAAAIGHTLLAESEQVLVTATPTGTTITVVRGINGTVAATHTAGGGISLQMQVYRYPAQIKLACLIQASRWWKRKDSGFATTIGMAETGEVGITSGLDSDVRLMLTPFIRRAVVAV